LLISQHLQAQSMHVWMEIEFALWYASYSMGTDLPLEFRVTPSEMNQLFCQLFSATDVGVR